MTPVASITTHWPAWMTSVGALSRSNSLVRSRCHTCGALLRIDIGQLVARHGADWTLIDRSERCAVVGCSGSSVYLASWSYGRPWRVLRNADPGIMAGAG